MMKELFLKSALNRIGDRSKRRTEKGYIATARVFVSASPMSAAQHGSGQAVDEALEEQSVVVVQPLDHGEIEAQASSQAARLEDAAEGFQLAQLLLRTPVREDLPYRLEGTIRLLRKPHQPGQGPCSILYPPVIVNAGKQEQNDTGTNP